MIRSVVMAILEPSDKPQRSGGDQPSLASHSLDRGPPVVNDGGMETSTKRPWWNRLRLSLRGLIALVLLIGGGMGWMVRSARVQRDAVAALERTPSAVFYDWQRVKIGSLSGYKLDAAPPWPRWLGDPLGV